MGKKSLWNFKSLISTFRNHKIEAKRSGRKKNKAMWNKTSTKKHYWVHFILAFNWAWRLPLCVVYKLSEIPLETTKFSLPKQLSVGDSIFFGYGWSWPFSSLELGSCLSWTCVALVFAPTVSEFLAHKSFCLLFWKATWAQREGIRWGHPFLYWGFQDLSFFAGNPAVGLCITTHLLQEDVSMIGAEWDFPEWLVKSILWLIL